MKKYIFIFIFLIIALASVTTFAAPNLGNINIDFNKKSHNFVDTKISKTAIKQKYTHIKVETKEADNLLELVEADMIKSLMYKGNVTVYAPKKTQYEFVINKDQIFTKTANSEDKFIFDYSRVHKNLILPSSERILTPLQKEPAWKKDGNLRKSKEKVDVFSLNTELDVPFQAYIWIDKNDQLAKVQYDTENINGKNVVRTIFYSNFDNVVDIQIPKEAEIVR